MLPLQSNAVIAFEDAFVLFDLAIAVIAFEDAFLLFDLAIAVIAFEVLCYSMIHRSPT